MARARGDADDARGTTGEEGEAEGRARRRRSRRLARRRDVVVAAGPRGAVVGARTRWFSPRRARGRARAAAGRARLRGGGVLVVGAVGAGTRRLKLERERTSSVPLARTRGTPRASAKATPAYPAAARTGEGARGFERRGCRRSGRRRRPPDLEAVGRRGAVGIIVPAHLDRDESPSRGRRDAGRGTPGERGASASWRRARRRREAGTRTRTTPALPAARGGKAEAPSRGGRCESSEDEVLPVRE